MSLLHELAPLLEENLRRGLLIHALGVSGPRGGESTGGGARTGPVTSRRSLHCRSPNSAFLRDPDTDGGATRREGGRGAGADVTLVALSDAAGGVTGAGASLADAAATVGITAVAEVVLVLAEAVPRGVPLPLFARMSDRASATATAIEAAVARTIDRDRLGMAVPSGGADPCATAMRSSETRDGDGGRTLLPPSTMTRLMCSTRAEAASGANGASSSASSATLRKRWSRSFSRHLRITASSSRGASGRTLVRRTGESLRIDVQSCGTDAPLNGMVPVRSSCSTTPSAHTSARSSTLVADRSCSGDMYTGVPKMSARRGDVLPRSRRAATGAPSWRSRSR